jgi:hypothetical protein
MAVNGEDSLARLSEAQDQPLVRRWPIPLYSTVPKALDVVSAEGHMETILPGKGV